MRERKAEREKAKTGRGLAGLGEFGFIARMARPFLRGLPAGVEGIGDDCAVLPWTKSERLIVTTDMLVEDRHFIRKSVAAEDLGYKSLVVNFSDIAAMGGSPKWALLSIGVPEGVNLKWLDGFFLGWRTAARPWDVCLVGGDTTKSPGGLIINVVVIGTVRAGREKYRSAARAGDIVAVTGPLGDSGGGLKILLGGGARSRDEKRLVRAHMRPRPHVEEGEWLAGQEGVRAMMDVSDGVDSDIRRIMEQSGVGAEIDLDKLPVSAELRKVGKRHGFDPVETAAAGGEDYCLLVTVERGSFNTVAAGFKRRFGRPLTAIGTIRPKSSGLGYIRDGRPATLRSRGFDHFR
jgi:thiamine-monophosphate kinase